MGVNGSAMGTGKEAAVVRVEVEPLVRIDQWLLAAVALQQNRDTFSTLAPTVTYTSA